MEIEGIEFMEAENAMELFEIAERIKFDYVRTIRIDRTNRKLEVTYINKTVKPFDFIYAIYLQAHIRAGAKLSHNGHSGPAIIYC
jgi:hypothetical protein